MGVFVSYFDQVGDTKDVTVTVVDDVYGLSATVSTPIYSIRALTAEVLPIYMSAIHPCAVHYLL